MKQQLAEALRKQGYRLTAPRKAILDVLADSREGLSPEQLCDRARQYHPQLGLVTVYRTLELLDKLGLARRVHSEGRCHEYAPSLEEQHHLICRSCGRVNQFPCHGLDTLISQVQQSTGYQVERHLLELTGLCPACRIKLDASQES